MLNSCENIRVSINIEQKKILVIPANSNDKDGVRWTKKADIIKAKKVSCSRLTTQLYDAWELDINYIYRAKGRLVTSGNKVMLLFDFTEAEKWKRPEAKNVK